MSDPVECSEIKMLVFHFHACASINRTINNSEYLLGISMFTLDTNSKRELATSLYIEFLFTYRNYYVKKAGYGEWERD